jgi:hypothetical protein
MDYLTTLCQPHRRNIIIKAEEEAGSATCSFETSVGFQRTTLPYIAKYRFHNHRCENFCSCILCLFTSTFDESYWAALSEVFVFQQSSRGESSNNAFDLYSKETGCPARHFERVSRPLSSSLSLTPLLRPACFWKIFRMNEFEFGRRDKPRVRM